jgi:hypothetical protein
LLASALVQEFHSIQLEPLRSTAQVAAQHRPGLASVEALALKQVRSPLVSMYSLVVLKAGIRRRSLTWSKQDRPSEWVARDWEFTV